MDATNNIATDLFYKIRSRFTGLKLGESTGQITINPEQARFFDFDYTENDKNIGHVSISLAEPNSMKVYFSSGITEGMDDGQKDNWYGFLRELRKFAKRRLLAFDTRDIAKDNLDRRDYAFLSQHAQPKVSDNNTITKPVGESAMNESNMYGTKTQSFQKLEDTRLIIKHSKTLEDDLQPGARTRNISALFVENQHGERFKYPFIHLAGARAMQRHVANSGLPYDAIGESIIRMSEEIAQLKSFTNYVVRNDLMNSDTNSIVERSRVQLDALRERIAKLSKQSHYKAYAESFQAQQPMEVPGDVMEQYKEKFTVKNFKEEISSVFPVLYRLMKEDETVGYDDIVAMTDTNVTEQEPKGNQAQTDLFTAFEDWAMNLGEASAIQSNDEEEKKEATQKLQELVKQHFPAGTDGTNAISSLEGIIDDPKLEQDIKAAAKQDSDQCVRPLVKKWLEDNAPDVVTELDFGDLVDEPTGEKQTQEAVMAGYNRKECEACQGEGCDKCHGKGYVEVQEGFMPKEIDGEVEFEFTGDDGETGMGYLYYKAQIKQSDEHGYYAEVDPKSLKGTAEGDGNNKLNNEFATYVVQPGETDHEAAMEVAFDDAMDQIKNADTKSYESAEEREHDNMGFTDKQIKMAYGVLNDPKYRQGNYDGAVEVINKIAPGLADHPGVKNALKRANEGNEFAKKVQDLKAQGAKKGTKFKTSDGEEHTLESIAEFIVSFYDKNTGTFPKGPEGVCTMVGKKFGEQAEQVARKMVERMAPHQEQGAEELEELERIKQLSSW